MGARRGWGRIRQLPSKRWQASYQGPDMGTHKALTTFETKMDAEGWLVDERRQIDAGKWTPPHARNAVKQEHQTFADFADTWMALRRPRGQHDTDRTKLRPRTVALYESILKRQLLPTFGTLPLTAVTLSGVKHWYAQLDVGATSKANAYGLLRTIMGAAVDDELIPVNPVRIKGAGTKRRERKLRVLEVDELNKIAEAIPARYKALVLTAAWCGGLRFGEIAALRRSDIDLKAHRLHVNFSLVTLKGEKFLGPPKSDASKREVSIPPHVVPILKAHLLEHAQFGKDGLVFPAADGKSFMAPSTLHKVFDKAKLAAGRPDIRVHDLRHFYGIMSQRAGATLAETQQSMGHSTLAAAMIYQSAVSDRHDQIADALTRLSVVE